MRYRPASADAAIDIATGETATSIGTTITDLRMSASVIPEILPVNWGHKKVEVAALKTSATKPWRPARHGVLPLITLIFHVILN